MHILFLTQYYPPEIGAPQARISELARHLSESGHHVTVLTCFPNYPTGFVPEKYRHRWFMREEVDSIPVTRTYVYATPNKGFVRRILNHLSFAISSFLGLRGAGQCEVVITESPPLFLGFSGVVISRMKKAKHVFNVADLWPESAIEMGQLQNRLLIWLSQRLADFVYNRSSLITVTSKGQKKRLVDRGISPDRIAFIPNGVDVDLFSPSPGENSVLNELNLGEKFVVFYGGTHGLAQGLRTAVEAAHILSDHNEIMFVFAGDGAEKKELMELARVHGLKNTLFLDPLPRREMPGMINAVDAGLISLRRLEIFGGVLPSKMFEYMSCAKPVIGAVEGDCRDVIATAECGIVVEPESPEQLADAVLRLSSDKVLREKLGANGRQHVVANYSRQDIARRLEQQLLSL